MSDEEILNTLQVISKLIYMQTRPRIEELKKELITTDLQKKIYDALDGQKTAKEIAETAGCSDILVWQTLPEWEKRGLILSFGKGPSKKYLNIENVEV